MTTPKEHQVKVIKLNVNWKAKGKEKMKKKKVDKKEKKYENIFHIMYQRKLVHGLMF